MVDIVKYIFAAILLASGIFAFNYFQNDFPTVVRVIGIIIMFVAAGFVMVQTAKGRYVWDLLIEARQEARKIIWPTQKETTQTTMIVIVAVFVIGLLLWAIDSLLVVGMRWLTGV